MEKFLIEQIMKTISDISLYVDNVETFNGTRKITEYLNIESSIGKYHGFMKCLKEINLDKFVEIHDLTYLKIDKALKKLEEIYTEMK